MSEKINIFYQFSSIFILSFFINDKIVKYTICFILTKVKEQYFQIYAKVQDRISGLEL